MSPALLRDWREIPSEVLERQETRQMLQEAVSAFPRFIARSFSYAMSKPSASRKPQKRWALVSRLLKCGFIGHA